MGIEIESVTAIAALRARDELAAAARVPSERAMAAVARRALFAEALLDALRARIDQLKIVAK